MRSRLFILALLVLLAPPALAGENALIREYHTYGGTIDVVAEAFRKLALVMSDSRYQGLFYGAAVLGIIFGSIGLILHGWVRGEAPTWGWMQVLLILLVGGTVYFGFLRKTDTLYVYDETTNEMREVPDVPDGVIALAGFFNRIETGLIELIDTSEPTGLSYRDGTGGVGLQLLIDASQRPLSESAASVHFTTSLAQYVQDCWLPCMGLNQADAARLYLPPSNDVPAVLADGANPALYTVWYDAAHPGGVEVRCDVAWNGGTAEDGSTVAGLSRIFSSYTPGSPQVQEYVKSVCAGVGFDADNPAVLQRCQDLFRATLARLITAGASDAAPNADAAGFLRNRIAAEAVYAALDQANPSLQLRVMAEREVRSAGIGMAVMANRYVPALKAAVTAIFLGVLPLLLVFVFTPAWRKVLAVAAGSFAFLCVWGVVDALTHSFVASRIVGLFRDVEALGIDAVIVKVPKNALDAMSLFGVMRMASVFFAGMITKSLFGFGGYMLAAAASHIVGVVQGAAARGADVALKPEVRGSFTERILSDAAKGPSTSMAVRELGGYRETLNMLERGQALELGSWILGTERTIQRFGGLDRAVAAKAETRAWSERTSFLGLDAWRRVAERYGLSDEDAYRLAQRWGAAGRLGEAAALESVRTYLAERGVHLSRAELLRALEEVRKAELKGEIDRSLTLGVSPVDLHAARGGIQAERMYGDAEVFTRVPAGTLGMVQSQEVLNETAKAAARAAAGDILLGGRLSPQTAGYIASVTSGLESSPRLLRAFQANLHQHLDDLTFQISSPAEARNVWTWTAVTAPGLLEELRQHGVHGPEDLVGKSLTVSAGIKTAGGRAEIAPLMIRGVSGFNMEEYQRTVARDGQGFLDVAAAPGRVQAVIAEQHFEGGMARITVFAGGRTYTLEAPAWAVVPDAEGGRPVVRILTTQYNIRGADRAAAWSVLMEHPDVFRELYLPAMRGNEAFRTEALNALAEQAAQFVQVRYGETHERTAAASLSSALGGGPTWQVVGIKGQAQAQGTSAEHEARQVSVQGIRTVLEQLMRKDLEGRGSFAEEASRFLNGLRRYAESGARVVVKEDGTVLVDGNIWIDAGKAYRESAWDDGFAAAGGAIYNKWIKPVAEGAVGLAHKTLDRALDEHNRAVEQAYRALHPGAFAPSEPKSSGSIRDEALELWHRGSFGDKGSR